MTSKDKKLESGDGEGLSEDPASQRCSPESTSASDNSNNNNNNNTSCGGETMKRAAAKKLIERYFYQLIDGCGNSDCQNEHCASSGKVKDLTPNQAAGLAIRLFQQEARLCDNAQPSPKVPRTTKTENETNQSATTATTVATATTAVTMNPCIDDKTTNDEMKNFGCLNLLQSSSHSQQQKQQDINNTKSPLNNRKVLNERRLLRILESCKTEGSYSQLIRTLGQVYSSPEVLGRSFLKCDSSPLDGIAPSQLASMKKEEVRQLEGEKEKDIDDSSCSDTFSTELESSSDSISVDLESLRRAYAQLFALSGNVFENALVHALITLSDNMELDLRMIGRGDSGGGCCTPSLVCSLETLLNALVIALEIPTLGTSDYLELALPRLCRAASHLPLTAQARLSRVWSRHCPHRLKSLLEALQQLVTLRVIMSRDYCVQDDEAITAPTKLMKIIYYASILAGELDSPDLRHEEPPAVTDDSLFGGFPGHKIPKQPVIEDPLSNELKVNVLDSRKPLIAFVEFYNEPLSDAVEMDKDFANYKNSEGESSKFSFMRYAFILTPATKTLGLYYDNRIRMYSERRMSFFQNVVGQPTNPYLRLKVRRDHIIDDALVELEMVAMENPKDLKKQLVVEFEGEQGIDEGGVSKEFFQLIVEEIFNPDYGMFIFQTESQTVWFNTTSFESDAQFTLIGIVLGLAIYNNIILDVHFPMVVYRKLMGKKGTFYDLEDWNAILYNSLKAMIDYEGEDMEEMFMQTFKIGYNDVFGNVLYHELKPNGDKIYVTQENKKEFVDLYANFLLNSSVEKQFWAFRRGFQMVTDESPLHRLFRPEEVEQLVCGSKKFDLKELEEATEYDGGYSQDTPIVRQFWEIAHALPIDNQRKLLQFATGSDRVPVGGLSKLKLIIARNGPDSDRLPTAHTCFNVLLLPEYESKEKLYDRLIKAISYSKGFGML
ncbi:ubiquitin protein ligase E3A isoform X1 [Lycorma delicatula]|uniref:ubiquitin protein ligase E3A isoform X1 n=2 Tax=Lycorma delicatula TaxID=130591 RepID=UPI003F50E2EF